MAAEAVVPPRRRANCYGIDPIIVGDVEEAE
jgi:hypothetical protein